MIDLRIDGQSAVVNEVQGIVFQDVNNMFDAEQGKGAYTYDIDLDMDVPQNARLYQHINRIRAVNMPTGRTAEMYADGRLVFRGTETILQINGSIVKIQVLCGNSEINFSGNDTRLKELDLGVLPDATPNSAKIANAGTYPDFICAYPPVMLKFDAYPYNEDADKFCNFIDKDSIWEQTPRFLEGTEFIGQPYLIHVIVKVFEAIGWNVGDNALLNMEYAKRMVIIHGHRSMRIQDVVPNWTVSKFLYEVQKLFNVIFVADDITKIVNIVNLNDYYENSTDLYFIKAEDIVDKYSGMDVEFNQEQHFAFNYNAVKYKMPSVLYYNRAELNEEVEALCEVLGERDFMQIESMFRNSIYYNKPFIFKDLENEASWVLVKTNPTNVELYHWERVQQFKKALSQKYVDGDSITELEIIPAEVFCLDIHPKDSNGTYYLCGAAVAYARNQDVEQTEDEESEEKGLNEWIDGDVPKDIDTSNDSLMVGQFMGLREVLWSHNASSDSLYIKYETMRYPMTVVTRFINGILHAAGSTRYTAILDAFFHDGEFGEKVIFDLEKRIKDVYAASKHVDENRVYTVKYLSRERKDVRGFYIIDGRRFVCISNEYRIENGSLSPYVVGKFLPYDIFS